MKARDTIITKYIEICLVCEKNFTEHGHHLICGISKRKHGTKDKLILPVCAQCHTKIHQSGTSMKLSKMLGQAIFEQTNTREEYRKKYGASNF